jgi:hypothetical protein
MKKLFGKSSGRINTVAKKIASVRFIVSLAVVLAVVAFGLWQYHNVTNKDKVFWGAVNNSLQTSSYSKHSITKSGGQSADQVTDVYLAPKQGVYSRTHYVQTGVDEAEATTENIGTPYADYVRYTNINTSQKSANGKAFDFSNIVNVWGGSPPDKSQTNGQLFGQSLLAAIPNADLTAGQRRELIKLLQEKRAYSFTATKTSHEGTLARPSYTYTVVLTPSAYVEALKQFGEYVGITQLKDLNPDDYKSATKSQFTITVDAWSHQITSMVEPGSSKSETVGGYNVHKTLPEAPTNAISIDELQSRLQSVE